MRAQHFVLSTGRQVIAGGGTQATQTISTGLEKFRIKKLTGFCSVQANDMRVRLTITKENRQMSNVLVPFADLIGTAQLPSFIENLEIEGNSQITIDLQNDNVLPQTYSITFIGEKLLTY